MPYIVAFSTSAAFCFIGETLMKKQKALKYLSFLFFAMAVLTLVALAGFRDDTIGTDIRTYVIHYFQRALNSNNMVRYITSHNDNIESVFLFITYIVSRFTRTVNWMYAVIASITYGCFFAGIYRYRRNISITFSWIIFILLFFSFSLNGMRQSMAMSILFLGSIHLFNKSYIKFILYMIIATLFHQTAIVGVMIMGIYILLSLRNNVIYKVLIILGAVILFVGYNYVLQYLMSLGILGDKFESYISNENAVFSINPFLQRIVPITFFCLYSKTKNKEEKTTKDYFMMMLILDLIFIQLRSVAIGMYRFALFFSMYSIYSYSYFIKCIDDKYTRNLIKAFLLLFLTGIWWYQVVLNKGDAIYPYTSKILGIY